MLQLLLPGAALPHQTYQRRLHVVTLGLQVSRNAEEQLAQVGRLLIHQADLLLDCNQVALEALLAQLQGMNSLEALTNFLFSQLCLVLPVLVDLHGTGQRLAADGGELP